MIIMPAEEARDLTIVAVCKFIESMISDAAKDLRTSITIPSLNPVYEYLDNNNLDIVKEFEGAGYTVEKRGNNCPGGLRYEISWKIPVSSCEDKE